MDAYLAIDLGAESGRAMLGALEGDCLVLEEIHRFSNQIVEIGGHLHWDLGHLEREIDAGVEKAASHEVDLRGISTDSWAVDYVLLDREGRPSGDPYCYRDGRTADSPVRLFKKLPWNEVYRRTGVQFMAINTIYQLEAQQHDDPGVLERAHGLLTLADYFNARLSGVGVIEQSMASTTQLYDPCAGTWSPEIVAALGLKPSLLPRIVSSGSVLGPVSGDAGRQPALRSAQVIAGCSHDTGAAVAAIPATGEDWAYISSGTWSLLGAELPSPIITAEAREAGFTNEVGLGGMIRFLKNIAGLWVLQECRRAWEADGKSFTYEELMQLAEEEGPASSHLALDDPRFASPGEMPRKIAAHCRETAQVIPETPAQFARAILESLALCYAQTLRELEEVTGRTFRKLHVVGGGCRSSLLNQLAADATGVPVIAGPVEATAIGNLLIQALALGRLSSAAQLRRVVRASFPTREFTPASARLEGTWSRL